MNVSVVGKGKGGGTCCCEWAVPPSYLISTLSVKEASVAVLCAGGFQRCEFKHILVHSTRILLSMYMYALCWKYSEQKQLKKKKSLPLWMWRGKITCDHLMIAPLLVSSDLTGCLFSLCLYYFLIILSKFMASNSTYASITPKHVCLIQIFPECQMQPPAVD